LARVGSFTIFRPAWSNKRKERTSETKTAVPPKIPEETFDEQTFGGLDLFDNDPDISREMDDIFLEERTINPDTNRNSVKHEIIKEVRKLQKGKSLSQLHIDTFNPAYTLRTVEDDDFFKNSLEDASSFLIPLDDTMKDFSKFLEKKEPDYLTVTMDGFHELLMSRGKMKEIKDDFNWDDF